MTNFKRSVPYLVAVLLVALCYAGVELSGYFLPDYKNTVSSVDLSQDEVLLPRDDDSDSALWPWDVYKSKRMTKPNISSAAAEQIDRSVTELIDSYSPYVAMTDEMCAFSSYIEWCYDDGYDLYFLHDVRFTDGDGTEYLLNIAQADGLLLYYSCVPFDDGELDYDTVSKVCEVLRSCYRDYAAQQWASLTYDDGELLEEYETSVYNPFDDLAQMHSRYLTYVDYWGDGMVDTPVANILSAIADGYTVTYTYHTDDADQSKGDLRGRPQLWMRMTYPDEGDRQAALFFDPDMWVFTGFWYDYRGSDADE